MVIKKSILGKLVRGATYVAGGVVKYGVKGTGEIASAIADATDNPKLAEGILSATDVVGDVAGAGIRIAGKGLGVGVDLAIEVGGEIGTKIGEEVAIHKDLDINKSKIVGGAIGSGLVGFAAGDVIGGAITSVTAATGVASTGIAIADLSGAAETSATLAAIGGGAVSVGGGGMGMGQVVLDGINVTTTLLSAGDGAKVGSKEKNTNLIGNKYDNNRVIDVTEKDRV